MIILGIETTCDETGASVVEGDPKSSLGLKVLSNVVASSFDLQKKYGGVVPEVAAREQVRVIIPVINEALENAAEVGGWKLETGRGNWKLDKESNIQLQNPDSHLFRLISKIDAIAVAYGPGLIGSLLIGVETAKTLALAWNKPLIPVNHLVGHIYANFIGKKSKVKSQKSKIEFPLIALVVSGGHTDLVLMRDHAKFDLLGSTLDDAAGEAFDKVARVLGMGYPGGPEIEKLASRVQGLESSIKLPRPMINSNDFDFSFSGLKTAVVNRVIGLKSERVTNKAEMSAEFQKAVVDVLVKKTMKAAEKFGAKTIIIGGGVAANELLRSQMTTQSSRTGITVLFPSKKLSVDNGAMIAAAAFYNFKQVDPLKLSADPSLHF